MNSLTQTKLRLVSYSIIFFMLLYIIAILVTLNERNTLEMVKQVPMNLYFWLLILSISSYLSRFSRWYYFLSPLQSSISIQTHLIIYFSGFALTTTPGKTGETIRSLFLSPLGIKYHQSLASFFSERLLDVLAALTLSLLLFTWAFPKYQEWVLLSALLMVSIFLLVRSKFISTLIERFFKHRSTPLLIAFQSHVSKFLSNKSLVIVLPLSLMAWTIQGYSLYLIVSALGFERDILLIIGIYNISILAGAISFIPGGIGATEAAISVLLIGVGMDTYLAMIASVICRAMTLWVAIIIGLLSISILGKKKSV